MLSELKNITAAYQAIKRVETSAPTAPAAIAPVTAPREPVVDNGFGSSAVPRVQLDPTAGVILEFLDSEGEVQTQTPSFVVVAYLRAGLTRDGLRPEEEGTSITA